jgi:hypothetical protein
MATKVHKIFGLLKKKIKYIFRTTIDREPTNGENLPPPPNMK